MSEDIAKLRADYKEVTGKNAFNGWDAGELQTRIDEALAGNGDDGANDGAAAPEKPAKAKAAPKAAPKAARQTIAVSIKRDIWDAEGKRHRKGTIIDMPMEEAMDAVEAGSVSRVKG